MAEAPGAFGFGMTTGSAALLAAAALALLVWCVRLEFRRSAPHRAARATLAAIAIVALVLAALRLEWRRAVRGDAVVLVTSGATTGDVRRAEESLRGAPVYALEGPGVVAGRGVRTLTELLAQQPALRHLHVAGWGPAPGTLTALRDVGVSASPAAPPDGIVRLVAPARATTGVPFTLGVEVGRPTSAARHAIVRDPGGAADTVTIAAGARGVSAPITPKARGAVAYEIAVAGLPADTVWIDVDDPTPLGAILLAASPNYEVNALKQWLARRGSRLAVRVRTSRDRFASEFVNRPEQPTLRLDATTLRGTQLLVTDVASLAALSGAERAAVRRAVREDRKSVV